MFLPHKTFFFSAAIKKRHSLLSEPHLCGKDIDDNISLGEMRALKKRRKEGERSKMVHTEMS